MFIANHNICHTKLPPDLKPDKSAGQYQVPESIALSCSAPTLCAEALLVPPSVQCDHVAQECVSHVLSDQYAVATALIIRPPTYTMLTRPSAAHEIYLSLFSGVYQVSRAIFGHLALVAYPDSSNRFGCDNYARALLLSMSPSAAGEGPRMFMITKDDHGGIIVVVGCIMMTWTLLCFMIRMYNRFTIRASLGLDDFACGLSTVRAQYRFCDRSVSHILTSTRPSESRKRS